MRGYRILTTAILVLMLTVVMGLRDVEAQTPLACEDVPFTTGWITMGVSNTSPTDDPEPPFSNVTQQALVYNAGLLGTVENFNGDVIAGLDWLYDDREPNLETNMVGTQLVSWWTRKDGRNTILQATNNNPNTNIIGADVGAPGFEEGTVKVHVQILGEDCIEIINFCDDYTPLDTVVYDFSNIVSNTGQNVSSAGLVEREGIVVITPVETCDIGGPSFTAVSWNFMQGNVKIINETEDWEYGINVRARTASPAEPFDETSPNVVRNFVFDYYSIINDELCAQENDENCPAGRLFKDFNTIGTNPGSDLVLISFGDFGLCGVDADSNGEECQDGKIQGNIGTPGIYTPGPLPIPTQFGPMGIYDDAENPLSCPPTNGCFLRIGIDQGIPSTDDVIPVPPPAECLLDPETGLPIDCNDPLCKPLDGCENPNFPPDGSLCTDGEDNDGVDGTDCADFGCDGFVVDSGTGVQCQSSGETSCADEFDNDNNGFTDCGLLGGVADPNCVAIGACGTPDDGGSSGGDGGCTVAAGPVTSGSSAANFLLPLLPLAGVFAARRIIRRRRK